ncbi:MAG: CopG family transcriptional regulator [Elusimicrobia bacterium]|nr:CopG family transcriptional regulator [Elusimicrobiota bacterium]
MKRSQIYLPVEQWRLLSMLSHQAHESISELIRRALERVYQRGKQPGFGQALGRIAGLWKDRRDLPPTSAYVRELRRDSRLSGRRARPNA